jgi:hypothetical protein
MCNVNNSICISMCILRDLPQPNNHRALCQRSSPILLLPIYIPMEIFLFHEPRKKPRNQKRVVYVRGGSHTSVFVNPKPWGAPP